MRAISLLGLLLAAPVLAAEPWTTYRGNAGPGYGKKVVLISGDEEYRSEETMTQLARILARHHGFQCTVTYAIDPANGCINPNVNNNIPGLEHLDSADLMVIFTRYRDLPDDQMKHIVRFVEAGKPIVALRTATHAFQLKSPTYARWNSDSKVWPGGFGRQVLGETWVAHHGEHGKEGTRGIVVKDKAQHPILRGIKDGDIFGPSDVYSVGELPGCVPLLRGQVTETLDPNSSAVAGQKNEPMMPIAWTRLNKQQRVFVTTLGAAQDFANDGCRRLLVNACYWAVGLEERIPPIATTDIVGIFAPSPFRNNGFKPGVRPSDFTMDIHARHGHLVAVGGGGSTPHIMTNTLNLAGGPKAKVVIVPQASQLPDTGESSAQHWREHGAVDVEVMTLDDKAKALTLIQNADLIWMTGGDQNRITAALNGTGILEAIGQRYKAGATIGGTSAGAAVQSGVMMTGEADLRVIRVENTKTSPGLDLWPSAIIDQHFIRRQRFNRLLSAVMDRPDLVGIGVDEKTAAVLRGSRLEVLGAGQVLVIDGRHAKVTPPAGMRDVRMHVLTEGMTFDLTPSK